MFDDLIAYHVDHGVLLTFKPNSFTSMIHHSFFREGCSISWVGFLDVFFKKLCCNIHHDAISNQPVYSGWAPSSWAPIWAPIGAPIN